MDFFFRLCDMTSPSRACCLNFNLCPSPRPVLLEVPHYASLRGKEREVVILRSDNGENWYEHPMQATEEAVAEALGSSAEGGAAMKGGMPNGGGIHGSQASVASLWSEHAWLFLFLCCFMSVGMPT